MLIETTLSVINCIQSTRKRYWYEPGFQMYQACDQNDLQEDFPNFIVMLTKALRLCTALACNAPGKIQTRAVSPNVDRLF